MKTKMRLIATCISVAMSISLCACGSKTKDDASTPTSNPGTPEVSQWVKNAGLDKNETPEELYELAKKEGKVVVYSMSSRIKDIKESFEAQYPGVTVEGYDMRMAAIFEKYSREYESGLYNCDVLFVKDSDGAMYNDFTKKGLLHSYIPQDIGKTIPEEYKKYGFVPYSEMKQIFYNTEVYKEAPIKTWWGLTRPEFKGKIMMANPISTAENMGIFMAMVQNADEMAAAYKEEFGEEIKLDGTENAGYEFLKRLVANDLIFTDSDGEIVEAIGKKGQTNPPIGIATSSKMRDAKAKDLALGTINNLAPKATVLAPAYFMVCDNAPHVAAAKLFIRWAAGETDGKGKGFSKFSVLGSWPARTDVPVVEGTPDLKDINLWPLDLDYNYENLRNINDFWISIQK